MTHQRRAVFIAHGLRRTRESRKREEQAAAIDAESLGFDGPPGPVRRADVDVGHVRVVLRDRVQHRRVVAEARFQIPTGKITADRGPAISRGIDQQQNADGHPLVVKQSVPLRPVRTRNRHAACGPLCISRRHV